MGEMAAEIERLQSIVDKQQSTAVAVPDYWQEEWKKNVMLMWVCVRKHDSSVPSDVLDFMRENLLSAAKQSTQRVTEQDAREILEGFCKFGHYSSEIGAFLGDSDCRALLAKLNDKSELELLC